MIMSGLMSGLSRGGLTQASVVVGFGLCMPCEDDPVQGMRSNQGRVHGVGMLMQALPALVVCAGSYGTMPMECLSTTLAWIALVPHSQLMAVL